MLSRREVLVGPVALSPIGLHERFLDITRKVDTATPHNGPILIAHELGPYISAKDTPCRRDPALYDRYIGSSYAP